MAEKSFFWTTENTEGGHDTEVSDSDLGKVFQTHTLLHGDLDEIPHFLADGTTPNLEITFEVNGAVNEVSIGVGFGMVNGKIYINDSKEHLFDIPILATGHMQKHGIYLRYNEAGKYVKLEMISGIEYTSNYYPTHTNSWLTYTLASDRESDFYLLLATIVQKADVVEYYPVIETDIPVAGIGGFIVDMYATNPMHIYYYETHLDDAVILSPYTYWYSLLPATIDHEKFERDIKPHISGPHSYGMVIPSTKILMNSIPISKVKSGYKRNIPITKIYKEYSYGIGGSHMIAVPAVQNKQKKKIYGSLSLAYGTWSLLTTSTVGVGYKYTKTFNLYNLLGVNEGLLGDYGYEYPPQYNFEWCLHSNNSFDVSYNLVSRLSESYVGQQQTVFLMPVTPNSTNCIITYDANLYYNSSIYSTVAAFKTAYNNAFALHKINFCLTYENE